MITKVGCQMISVVRWGGVNKTVDEVMFNVVSASSLKSYNSENKLIVQYYPGRVGGASHRHRPKILGMEIP